LSFTKFSVNDTHHFSRYQNVEITNNGDKEITYTFSVQDAGGFNAMAADPTTTWAPVMHDIRGVNMYELKTQVRMHSGAFRVKPGETKKAE
jgi:hypothetical protein